MTAVNRFVDWLRRHPVAADMALVVTIMAFSIFAVNHEEASPSNRELDWFAYVLIVGTCLPILTRRSFPVASAWVMLGFTTPYWVLDYPDEAVGTTMLIAIYSVGAHIDRPRSLNHGVALIATILIVGTAGVISPDEDLPWFAIPAFLVMYGTAWVLGDNLRTRRAYMRGLERTAAHAEGRRQAEASRAVADERTRIARELHDVVAHSMSVMVVQAGAARRVLES
ncbi:MAG: histidine kinase dimerization/phosphoacceptor domain-containing protein, partial [Actinomycetota bacterium]